MIGFELPGYVGIMAEQCMSCSGCMGCGWSWALVVLVAATVFATNPR